MCIIGLAVGVHPDFPVVVAANRDEFYGRPTEGPQRLGPGPIVGGRDLEAGGTWMGVTAAGFFVGLTNQRPQTPPAKAPRSRGEIVVEALEAGTIEAVDRLLAARTPADYSPFNLVYGSATEGLKLAYARPEQTRFEHAMVPAGVHALPNDRLDSPRFPKAARLVDSMTRALVGDPPWSALSEGLVQALADDRVLSKAEAREAGLDQSFLPLELVRRLDAINIQTPGYGTRSATLVALTPGAVAWYGYIDGRPGEAGLVEFTDLLRHRTVA